jgi:histidine racemase
MPSPALIISSKGNLTCIVDESCFDESYEFFSFLVRQFGVEQAGAIKPQGESSVQLRMMGREFSLNGLASAVLAYLQLYSNQHRRLTVNCDLAEGSVVADVAIGDWCESKYLKIKICFSELNGRFAVLSANSSRRFPEVRLPGIRHIFVSVNSERPSFDSAKNILANQKFGNLTVATGVIFYRVIGGDAEIWPYVSVPNVGTLIAETSCGSGALALAMLLLHEDPRVQTELKVKQPAGGETTIIPVRDLPGRVPGVHFDVLTRVRLEVAYSVDALSVTSMRAPE